MVLAEVSGQIVEGAVAKLPERLAEAGAGKMVKRARLKRKAVSRKRQRLPYLYRVSLATYNVDYPEFEKLFIRNGGTARMARHLWEKWKVDKRDDFLAMFGQLDLDNQRIMQKLVDDLLKKRKRFG